MILPFLYPAPARSYATGQIRRVRRDHQFTGLVRSVIQMFWLRSVWPRVEHSPTVDAARHSGLHRIPTVADVCFMCDAAAMRKPCCAVMGFYGREVHKGAPESDLPDALIDLHRDTGAAMLRTPAGRCDLSIHFCPWCGARISDMPTSSGHSE